MTERCTNRKHTNIKTDRKPANRNTDKKDKQPYGQPGTQTYSQIV